MGSIRGKFLLISLAIAMLAISAVIHSCNPNFFVFSSGGIEKDVLTDEPKIVFINKSTAITNATNNSNSTYSSIIPELTPKPTISPIANSNSMQTIVTTPFPLIEIVDQALPYSLNETVLISAINSLKNGGEIVLEENVGVIAKDVIIPSNIVLVGANPEITIYLVGNYLKIAANSSNVVIKDLTIDASGSNERALIIGQGANRILVENVAFKSYAGSLNACLLSSGNNVELNNLVFTNVSYGYPIRIQGSNVSVRNCSSSDDSKQPLIVVGGGVSNINIIGNTALKRPLLGAFYSETSSKNILIENNTNYFPNGTYAIQMQGGMGTLETSHENVTVKGNFFRAAAGAWNAISIYGLTKNSLVVGNTVDMTLSGHNGIGISSGVNVTVVGNVVYGALEATEGGIEVESNPVHNRGPGYSENVTVTGNTVYNSFWGVYVRVMVPDHPNWAGSPLLSRNILIDNNVIYNCKVGVNLLQGENIVVKNNDIAANFIPFKLDPTNVFHYTVADNVGYSES
jgi:hypothetical protein